MRRLRRSQRQRSHTSAAPKRSVTRQLNRKISTDDARLTSFFCDPQRRYRLAPSQHKQILQAPSPSGPLVNFRSKPVAVPEPFEHKHIYQKRDSVSRQLGPCQRCRDLARGWAANSNSRSRRSPRPRARSHRRDHMPLTIRLAILPSKDVRSLVFSSYVGGLWTKISSSGRSRAAASPPSLNIRPNYNAARARGPA